MLGEQGGNSRWGKWSGDEDKTEGAKNIFLFATKRKREQIDLGWNIWYQFKLFCTG